MYLPAILVILSGLTITLLCIPLDLVFLVDSSRTPAFRIRASWLFGLVSRETSHTDGTARTGRMARRKATGRSRVGRRLFRGRKGRRLILQVLRTGGIGQITRLLRDLVARVRIREFVADVDVGLGDPADTGLLFAILGPLVLFANSSLANGRMALRPDFTPEPVLDGYSRLGMRVSPIQFVSPLVRFALSRSGMRTARVLLLDR